MATAVRTGLMLLFLTAMITYVGVMTQWEGPGFYISIFLYLFFLIALETTRRDFMQHYRAWPEQARYRKLVRGNAVRVQAEIVECTPLREGRTHAYPLVRLVLDVQGIRVDLDVLMQPELGYRFRPGNTVAVLCDATDPRQCAIDREQVALQLKPVHSPYVD